MAHIGEIIDGKYEILHEIGRGGMSIVYLAMDKRLNKQWAIKEFRKDKNDAAKQIALKALLDEANLMKKLDHPTLPRIVDIIDDYLSVYIIMDYIEGESLNKVLDAYGAQPQEAVIEWAKQLSEVLDYLHTRTPPVIYRDMKPSNVMLKPDGTVRLIDFGIAREYKEGKEGDTEAIGTRGYAAPEQFGGKGQTDARTDIYSLGVTLYHLVTGKNPTEPPYELYPIRHWIPSLSGGLEWLIEKCTQLNPNDRYQSCAEVTYVLENLEKFDTEYKKKKKGRINLFAASVIMTVVFALTSAGSFLGSSAAKKNSYDSLIRNEDFIEAIAIDNDNPLAYVRLADMLYDEANEVVPGDARGQFIRGNEVTIGDLLAWFPDETMKTFRDKYRNDYVKIEFRLGFLIWQKYGSGGAADAADTMRYAMPYFQKVILSAGNGDAAGLTKSQYNLAKTFYLVSFFQVNRNKFIPNAAGEIRINEEDMNTLKAAGIDLKAAGINLDSQGGKAGSAGEGEEIKVDKKHLYCAFWNTNREILAILNSSEEAAKMTNTVKVETLRKLSYILHENHTDFKYEADIPLGDMSELLRQFKTAFEGITGSDENIKEKKREIAYSYNTIIGFIGAEYGTHFETINY